MKLDLNATTISFVSDVNCCVLPTLLPQNLKCNSSLYSASFYCPQTNLREGNVFTTVCDSVHRGNAWQREHAEGVCGTEEGVNGRGCVWQGSCMVGEGDGWQGDLHGRGACVAGDMHGRGGMCGGGGMHGRRAYMAGGMCGRGVMHGRGGMHGRGAYIAGGIHGRRGVCGGGHAWQWVMQAGRHAFRRGGH